MYMARIIHREYEDILLLDDLCLYLYKRYDSNGLSDIEVKTIINKLKLVNASPLYAGSREAFQLVNEGLDLIRDDILQK